MAYSLLAHKKGSLNWEKFKDSFMSISEGSIEVFPISIEEEENESCIGISIPTTSLQADPDIWIKIIKIVKICSSDFSLMVYDLYSGQYIFDENLQTLKKNILGE